MADHLASGGAHLPAQEVGRDASPLLRPGSLGAIVGNFKSVTTRWANRMRGAPGAVFWQRNCWEHIIRNDESLRCIRAYIRDNPARWAEDRFHPGMRGAPALEGQVSGRILRAGGRPWRIMAL